ncbi:MAG: SDR family oxidoreductase [Polyangiales bacterium]
MQLNGLKVIVTGAAQGMGAHFAQRLLEAGATVAAGDINEEGLHALPSAIHRRRLDVASETDCVSFVDWAADTMGGVDALINNAGILRDGLLVKKDRGTGAVVKFDAKSLRAVLEVNLVGAIFMVREVAAKMVEREGRAGVIVNLSSLSRHGNRGQTSYVAAKAALAANTVTWAREFAPFGIRVCAVAPGMIETPMTQGMNQKARDALVAAVPCRRVGVPEDVWLAVRFALECDYFNARTVDVDGGLTMT